MKPSKRIAHELLIIAVVSLGSCAPPANRAHSFTGSDYNRLDDADTNARNALDKTEDLETRLKAVEDKLNMDQ